MDAEPAVDDDSAAWPQDADEWMDAEFNRLMDEANDEA